MDLMEPMVRSDSDEPASEMTRKSVRSLKLGMGGSGRTVREGLESGARMRCALTIMCREVV
jgi:hypothetical protein